MNYEQRRWFDEGAIVLLAVTAIITLFVIIIISSYSSSTELLEKCEKSGGVLTEYRFHRSPNNYVCLKKEYIVDFNGNMK